MSCPVVDAESHERRIDSTTVITTNRILLANTGES
jgi:hypothetical protein